MSDAIVRDILQGWKRPLDMAALKQAADHGNDGLHDEDHPLTYRVGDLHVVVARAPRQGPQEHGAAVGATAEEAANKLLAMIGEPKQPAPTISEESVSHETLADELPSPVADVPAVVPNAGPDAGETAAAPADSTLATLGNDTYDGISGWSSLNEKLDTPTVDGVEALPDSHSDDIRGTPGVPDASARASEVEGRPETPIAYSGVALVRDELGALRNHVLMRIAQEKLLRLDANADEGRRSFLRQAASDYHNLEGLGIAPNEQQVANYADYLELENFERDIAAYALALERAAMHADMPMLRAMAVNPWTAG